MCGRYSFSLKKETIKKHFDIEVKTPLLFSYNIAPTHDAYVIANNTPNQLSRMEWGLVPAWSRDGRNSGKLINARTEGIATKPSFRMPIRFKRCLVLGDSFYEWKKEGQSKIPYRILSTDSAPLIMAGIWDTWTDGVTQKNTFAIITTTPNKDMEGLHNRMPVFLETKEKQKAWLTETDLNQVLQLLQPLSDGFLQHYRISQALNSPSNNNVKLQEKVEEPLRLF